MRKQIIGQAFNTAATDQEWLDLDTVASVEVTSEDSAFPIECALLGQGGQGWRAAKPGVQNIRLIFDQPHHLKRISLVFVESEVGRTQEFTLRWSPDRGNSFQEIVRQQWNFSWPNATRETEDYEVHLSNVTLLDLTIQPDKERGISRASLLSLRVA